MLKIRGNAIYQPIAPLTIIFKETSREASLELCSAIRKTSCLEIMRDAWLDISSIDLETLIEIHELVRRSGRKSLDDNIVIHIEKINREYIDYIVMDHINTPLSWLSFRREFTDPIYKKCLAEYRKIYPREIMLGFLIGENNIVEPYMVVKHRNNLIYIEAYKPIKPSIEKALFWHIIDLLL